jgi:hypothetical protein
MYRATNMTITNLYIITRREIESYQAQAPEAAHHSKKTGMKFERRSLPYIYCHDAFVAADFKLAHDAPLGSCNLSNQYPALILALQV